MVGESRRSFGCIVLCLLDTLLTELTVEFAFCASYVSVHRALGLGLGFSQAESLSL